MKIVPATIFSKVRASVRAQPEAITVPMLSHPGMVQEAGGAPLSFSTLSANA
jgi:hypothetical protein